MNSELAAQLSVSMLDISTRLNRSLQQVLDEGNESDFLRYRDAVSKIMATIASDVLNPLYKEYPEVKPSDYYLT